MKHIVLAVSLALSATPSLAQEAESSDIEEGASLLEQGARLMLKGFMDEMEPTLGEMAGEMQKFAETVEPAMRQLVDLMDDFSNYHAPEILPNGDIIIRRKTPLEATPDGEIDL